MISECDNNNNNNNRVMQASNMCRRSSGFPDTRLCSTYQNRPIYVRGNTLNKYYDLTFNNVIICSIYAKSITSSCRAIARSIDCSCSTSYLSNLCKIDVHVYMTLVEVVFESFYDCSKLRKYRSHHLVLVHSSYPNQLDSAQ